MTTKPYVTITTANRELAIAIPVDVDLYGAGVVLFYGRPRTLRALPGPHAEPQRRARELARAFVEGREDELEAMLAAARTARR